ncbi:hypothetical protein [Pseudactinotalea sp. HY158]|uniref:hypothetical protein n=2 Tax=unclassified Pseudactinotalea TaxID=2649176 RepID=UPI00129C7112|nr:hypothetical protein [Pseudactinotalea sp. HY158]QGH70462.1 hypothetical protein GCE65_13895 [Pseudactinotalea sp. HY158]
MAAGGMGGAGGRGSDKKKRRGLGLQALQLDSEEAAVDLGPGGGAGVREHATPATMDTDDLL